MVNKATGLSLIFFMQFPFFKLSPKVSFSLSMCRQTMFRSCTVQYRSHQPCVATEQLNVQTEKRYMYKSHTRFQRPSTIKECKFLSLKS